VWYFLRLQATDDELNEVSLNSTSVSVTPTPPASASWLARFAWLSPSALSKFLSGFAASVAHLATLDRAALVDVTAQSARALAGRTMSMLRPMCLVALVVSIIKISGLLFALNAFSISRIELVRTFLIAALAFAQYTAAFFVSFFMLILAIDMRRLEADRAWRMRLRLYANDELIIPVSQH
jgi:hypothetical protein